MKILSTVATVASAILAGLFGIASAAFFGAIVYCIYQGEGLLFVYFFGLLFSLALSMAFSSMAEGFGE